MYEYEFTVKVQTKKEVNIIEIDEGTILSVQSSVLSSRGFLAVMIEDSKMIKISRLTRQEV